MKIKIHKIYRGEQETKNGIMPKVAIQIDSPEYTNKDGKLKWISALGSRSKGTESWKIGDEVEIEITQSGEFLNFVLPDVRGVTQDLVKRIEALEKEVFKK